MRVIINHILVWKPKWHIICLNLFLTYRPIYPEMWKFVDRSKFYWQLHFIPYGIKIFNIPLTVVDGIFQLCETLVNLDGNVAQLLKGALLLKLFEGENWNFLSHSSNKGSYFLLTTLTTNKTVDFWSGIEKQAKKILSIRVENCKTWLIF